MSNMIEVLAEQLQEVNKVIETQARVSDVSFKDVLVLVRFYDEYKNTNGFIDEAEQRAHDNVGALLVCVTKLQGLIRRLLSLDMSVWNEVNFASLEQRHLKAYQDKWNRAKEKSTKLWQEYQSLSNRLDMMDFNSEDYRVLDIRCEKTKIDYENAHEETEECYAILKMKEKDCAHVHYFEMQFLLLWAAKMMEITDAIRTDAKRLLKERNA